MLWVLIDIALGVLVLVVLGTVGARLYKHVRGLLRTLAASATTLGDASAELSASPPTGRQRP